MSAYQEFLHQKSHRWTGIGNPCSPSDISPILYPFQAAVTAWAIRKGRAAIFADCGLGKTLQQLEWAQHQPGRVLILAPLCVADQTIQEAQKLGMTVSKDLLGSERIVITNYERLHQVDADHYQAVVLDESSILKSMDGKTRTKLIALFQRTPRRLCCTATPSPNDIAELTNHAEFLGIMSRAEMLATFFVHDEAGWRLKGHAAQAFYRWLASWACFFSSPADLGFDHPGFALPPLHIHQHVVSAAGVVTDRLPGLFLGGIKERLAARKQTITERSQFVYDLIAPTVAPWLVWCGLNDEGRSLHGLLNGRSLLIEGADSEEEKEARLKGFLEGTHQTLVSKPRITGFGLNLQRCSQMAFLGLGDSYEQYYQAIRRCWRYGQTNPVDVHIVVSDVEQDIVANVQRKEREARAMMAEMVEHVALFEQEEIGGREHTAHMKSFPSAQNSTYDLHHGDCVEVMRQLPEASIDFSIYSPPFMSLYTYTDSPADMGNCRSDEEFMVHFGYFTEALRRLTKPGRLSACHVAQVPAMQCRDGYIGLKDFRGRVINTFIASGWTFHGEVAIDKNPQAQAIRTKAKALLFKQLRKDASCLRPALCDFLLLFRAPGDNVIPITTDIDNETWITWAHGVWYDIRESETLRYMPARDEEDERHICPLQLSVIERGISLWSNPGEVVLSPFMGIGSEGVMAMRTGRRFTGIELKDSYFRIAQQNIQQEAQIAASQGEFALSGA
jgi:DNA modification methylase/superfamily II DNA or RNA helicase